MAENAWWRGSVSNSSNIWVWVVYDQGSVWRANLLAPGRRSPRDLDADGFKAASPGTTIDGWSGWWWCKWGNDVIVSNSLWSGKVTACGTGLYPFVPKKEDNDSGWGSGGAASIQYDYGHAWGRAL